MSKNLNEKDPYERNFRALAVGVFIIMIFFALLFADKIIFSIGYLADMSEYYSDMTPADKAWLLTKFPCEIVEGAAMISIAAIICTILFGALKNNTPFLPSIGKKLRIIVIIYCTAFVIMFVIRVIAENTAASVPSKEYIGMFINGYNLIFVSFLTLLSFIFDRGFKLQKDSDETI